MSFDGEATIAGYSLFIAGLAVARRKRKIEKRRKRSTLAKPWLRRRENLGLFSQN